MTLLLDRWGVRGGGGPFPFSANTKTTQLTKPNCNACSNSLPFSHIHTITPTGTNTHACWSLKHTHWKTQQVVSVCVSVCAYSAHRTYSLTQAGMHIKTHTHIYTLAKPRLYIGLLYWQSKYCYWITIQGWLVCVLWVWKRRPTALCRHVCVCSWILMVMRTKCPRTKTDRMMRFYQSSLLHRARLRLVFIGSRLEYSWFRVVLSPFIVLLTVCEYPGECVLLFLYIRGPISSKKTTIF